MLTNVDCYLIALCLFADANRLKQKKMYLTGSLFQITLPIEIISKCGKKKLNVDETFNSNASISKKYTFSGAIFFGAQEFVR